MNNCISEKMFALTQKNSAVREMFEEGRRLAAIHGAENVYDFSLGNPYFPAPDRVKTAIVEVLEQDEPSLVHGYMPNAGFPDVREALAKSLNHRFDTDFTGGNIIMTAGAAGGLNVALKTLINPDDEVIVLAPFFLEYGNYVSNYGGKLVVVPAHSEDFQPNADEIAKFVTEKTKAIIINSPNNPTGVIYSEDTIKKIAAMLNEMQEKYNHPIFLISDEPYRELAYDGAKVPWLTHYYKNTIVGYSWSKSLSLPGERIGYLVIPSELHDFSLVFDAAGIANRILGFVNAPSLMQRAVAKCLEESTDIASYDANRKLLYNGLQAAGFDCAYPQGAFYMWLKTPCDDKEFVKMAKKYNILVVSGSSFACSGYVRIAYCVGTKTIEGALSGFAALAAELGLRPRD
ncbi:MAG: pyridoxal phosphate-dependent aminotransferase [Clostridiales bacterium]|nr:pyridoxal phosphate-dependent aminotransferase [Clostridiales bacterium]